MNDPQADRLRRFLRWHQDRHRHKLWLRPEDPGFDQEYRSWGTALFEKHSATDAELRDASDAVRGRTRRKGETWYPEDHLDWLLEEILASRTRRREEADREQRRAWIAQGEADRRRRAAWATVWDQLAEDDREEYRRRAHDRVPASSAVKSLERLICLDLLAEDQAEYEAQQQTEQERRQAS